MSDANRYKVLSQKPQVRQTPQLPPMGLTMTEHGPTLTLYVGVTLPMKAMVADRTNFPDEALRAFQKVVQEELDKRGMVE